MTTPHSIRLRRGNILLLALVFAGIFATVGAALVGYMLSYGRSERTAVAAAQALLIAEGALEKASYELNQNPSYSGEANVPLGGGTFTIAVENTGLRMRRVAATGYVPSSQNPVAIKTIKADIGINNSIIAFHYGVQAGDGGFSLENSSKITGNAFSSGPVVGTSANYIYGDVISSGASGWVYGIHATSSVYAHTIGKVGNATFVDKDAYYVTKVNTTVGGTSYPGSPDQPDAALPISDEQIGQWETDAAAGGTISSCDVNGNYTISTSVSLGPKKITCNLIIKSASGILTVTGPLWVTGNISIQTGPTIKIAASLGDENVAIIADNPANPTGSGKITVGQSAIFEGSGSPNSFVFLISQNRSAEQGGSEEAIEMGQGASALVAYASHGLIKLNQSVSVKEVTGYKIELEQSANVIYAAGLPNTIFQSGAGGSWCRVPGSYAITR